MGIQMMPAPLTRTMASGIVGYIGWYGYPLCLPVAALLLPIWHRAQSRLEAYAAASLYYLAAVHQLPLGAHIFFDSAWVGLAIWIGIGLLMPIPYVLLWRTNNSWLLLRLVTLILIISVPPLGVFGMANPITGAGTVLPGLGWTGLIVFIALLYLLILEPIKASGVLLLGVLLATQGTNSASDSWQGTSTKLSDLRPAQSVELYHRQRELINLVSHSSERMIVLPESVAGEWHEGTSALWKRSIDGGKKVLVGANWHGDNHRVNGVILVSSDGSDPVYIQRQPVPLSMWNPLNSRSYKAPWLSNAVVELQSLKVGFLICYEQTLVWPVLHTMYHKPQLLIATANLWWARGTRLSKIQQSIVSAWGRLFAVPVVYAFNE
jgi:hypothetical protein